MTTIDFHAQHGPMGSFASFTCGRFGKRGGFGLELGRPASQNLWIGYQKEGEEIRLLPFYEGQSDQVAAFTPESEFDPASKAEPFRALAASEITREVHWASDTWRSGPLAFSLLTPFAEIPDPATASETEMKRASCPTILAVLAFDNRGSKKPMKGCFALGMNEKKLRELDFESGGHLVGLASGRSWGFACRPQKGVTSWQDFGIAQGFSDSFRRRFRLPTNGGLLVHVEPGEVKEVVIALGWHKAGVVTTGLDASYWYGRYFPRLESALDFALEEKDATIALAKKRDAELASSRLNAEQKFLVAHSTKSYWGSTQWLERGGHPLWVVNEGEYEMINTFDLTVDQVFFEMRFAPWAVKNELEFFRERYSYRDDIHRFGVKGSRAPGGLSFTHDQGVSNHFTPPGISSYELSHLPAKCFSYMTHEQLVNWVLVAGVYLARSRDGEYLARIAPVLEECLESMLRRDDPDPAKRDGIMKWDSTRCGEGAEITTYDSLDASLGQARANLYLAGKCWAAYLAIENLLEEAGRKERSADAAAAALRVARTLASKFDPKLGYIPAVFEGGNASAILPAIEGLVFPKIMGLTRALDPKGPYGDYLAALNRHFDKVFVKGVCRFDDGGWKLSSTSNNSWMSKIALCQYVARTVLGRNFGEDQLVQDRAHADWQRLGSADWACSDQFILGEAKGSRYYPRIVTSYLWLME